MTILATIDTRVGWVGLAGSECRICGLTLPLPIRAEAAASIKSEFPDGRIGSSPAIDRASEQLRAYFEGRRRTFDVEIDLPERPLFWRRVWGVVAHVPYGETVSYGEVARRAGAPKAARAVGGAMAHNPIPLIIPCHRVVGGDGRLTGFGGGLGMKRLLLELEGVRFSETGPRRQPSGA